MPLFFPPRASNHYGAIMSSCLLGILALTGCGEPPTYPVSGTVTLDGKPLEGAAVSFVNKTDPMESAVATTDASGAYILQITQQAGGMAPGMYQVRISTMRGESEDPDNPRPAVPERVPPKYNVKSELEREVKEDEPNTFDFDLTTK